MPTEFLASGSETSVAAHVARELAARIVAGKISPGSRLLQDELALEFGVSQVSVRDAFQRLERQGLAFSEPRKGVRVAPLDPAAIQEVTEMRAALEALALKHALPRITSADLEKARAALVEADSTGDVVGWESANRRFHMALLEPCGMPRLLDTLKTLHGVSSRYLIATWQTQAWQHRSDKEHHHLLDAVERQSVAEALAIVERHVIDAGNALIRACKKNDAARSA